MRRVWMIDELFFFVFFLFSFTDSQNAFSELYVCHRLVDWGEGRLALYTDRIWDLVVISVNKYVC